MTVVKQVVYLQKNKHGEVISQPIFSKIGIYGKLRSRPQYKICHIIKIISKFEIIVFL